MSEILKEVNKAKKRKGGRNNKFPIEDMLLMALEYLREYRTYFHISQSYGVNEKLYYQAVRKHAQKIHNDSHWSFSHYMISGGCLFTKESDCGRYIPYADTFGFAIPTATSIKNGLCRYSVGLNPKGLQ